YRHGELNLEGIQHKKDGITFDIPSATKARITYIVDPTIGICSCYVGSVAQERSFYASLHHRIHTVFKDNTINQPEIQESTISSEFISNFDIKRTTFTENANSKESNASGDEKLNANSDEKSNTNSDEESDLSKGISQCKKSRENKLVLFVYQHASSPVTIRGGKKIPVQVALVQRRKGTTRRQSLKTQPLDKKNKDLHKMQPRKKR
ncbi:11455_t:CDS:2, partial [Gigaspora margarita]